MSSYNSLEERMLVLLEQLEKVARPLVLCIDHAECIFLEDGAYAPCWERFFTRFLRHQHLTTLLLASKHWPGWYHGERDFVVEHPLPPLPQDTGVLLLQRQGLEYVPVSLLLQVHEKVGGIPLGLE